MIEELIISKSDVDEMVEHCRAGRPNEACGLLGWSDGRVARVYPMRNASASPVRYSLDPAEQLAVYNALEAEGRELGGVFHSHTRTAAYPSPTDVRQASEVVPYVIVSLAQEPPDVKAFLIIKDNWTDEDGEIREIPVTVEG